jgi:hypothetical protein
MSLLIMIKLTNQNNTEFVFVREVLTIHLRSVEETAIVFLPEYVIELRLSC